MDSFLPTISRPLHRGDLPHPALRQDFTPSPSRAYPLPHLYGYFGREFGRPFPSQICFADVRGIVHRLGRDRLEGLATAVSNTNGGMDLQPHGAEIASVW